VRLWSERWLLACYVVWSAVVGSRQMATWKPPTKDTKRCEACPNIAPANHKNYLGLGRARTSISTCSCHCASMLTPYSILFRIPTSTATTKPRRMNAQHSTCTNANSPFYLQTCTVHRTNLQLSVTVYFGFGPPREGKSSVSFTSSDFAGTRGTP
jgi:hypothetical protein